MHLLGALPRLFPVTWARYEVRFGHLRHEEAQGTGAWLLGLEMRPAKWRRGGMQPVKEYLLIQRSKEQEVGLILTKQAGNVSAQVVRGRGS